MGQSEKKLQKTEISIANMYEPIQLSTRQNHLITILTNQVDVEILEAEDFLFRYKSALLLPTRVSDDEIISNGETISYLPEQERVTGLILLLAIFRYCARSVLLGEKRHMLIAGHTDSVGSSGYNAKLSKKRGEVLLSLLLGGEESRETFVDIVSRNHTKKDEQHILKWFCQNYEWPDVDPGEIDGVNGEYTKKAIRNLKEKLKQSFEPFIQYKHLPNYEVLTELIDKLQFGPMLGDNFWAVLFEIYLCEIQLGLEKDDLLINEIRNNFLWVDENKKVVGCGETWPIEARGTDNYRSQSNRRVEILFYDPAAFQIPTIPCNDENCTQEDCHIYRHIDRPHNKKDPLHPDISWTYLLIDGDGCVCNGELRIFTDFFIDDDEEYSFVLTSDCGYYHLLSTRQDHLKDDDWVVLNFYNLPTSAKFTLKVFDYNGVEFLLFSGVKYSELSNLSDDLKDKQVLPSPDEKVYASEE